jgi:uncharacterized protein YbaP (TraB family)
MHRTNNFIVALLLLLFSEFFRPVNAQLLWKVSAGENTPTLYLFGTMHLAADGFLAKHDYVRAAIDASDVVFTEAAMDQNEIATQVLQYIFLPEGMQLSDSLDASEWTLLDSALRSFNNPMISTASMARCKPMYVLITVSSLQFQKYDTSTGDALQKSVDYSVVKYAESQHKNLRYFETTAQQLQYLLNDPPLEMQFRLLKKALRQKGSDDSVSALISKLPEYYHRQSLDTIARIMEYMNPGGGDDQKLYDILLRDRNYRWLETIKHFVSIGRNSAFIAVGAGHLVGETGLIELLRSEGFVVEAVFDK